MSRIANDWAWGLDIKPASLKLLLLAMADRADEEHCCFPSIPRLEKDTGLNRKTVLAGINKLIVSGVLRDTGERKGATRRTKVYKLVGVESNIKIIDGRNKTETGTVPEKEPFQKGDSSDNGIIPKTESTQKRNDSKSGTLNSPKNGTLNSPENGTQNQSVEPPIEPEKDLAPSKSLDAVNHVDEVLFRIPLRGKSQEHPINRSLICELQELYPAVNVSQQIRNMIGWCLANPRKQKTAQGVNKFIHGWLCREQDKGYGRPNSSVPDFHSGDTDWANGLSLGGVQ